MIKGGIYLEQLSELKAIAFDKTGTFTKGKPVVTDSFFFAEKELSQQLLVSMETKTTHPLGSCDLHSFDCTLPKLSSPCPLKKSLVLVFQTIYLGEHWAVGNKSRSFFRRCRTKLKTIEHLEDQGKTVIYLSKDRSVNRCSRFIRHSKSKCSQAVDFFLSEKIHTSIITGDNEGTAKAIASQVGIDSFYANSTPAEKTAYIQTEKETIPRQMRWLEME